MNLHCVTQKRLFRLGKLLRLGRGPQDGRGYNKKFHAIHINCFPVKTAHYGGSEVKYLDSELNVKLMYSMFKASHQNTKVKYSFFTCPILMTISSSVLIDHRLM